MNRNQFVEKSKKSFIIFFFISLILLFLQFFLLNKSASAEEVNEEVLKKKIFNNKIHSLVLIDEGLDFYKQGNVAQAKKLLLEAKTLSPDIPQIYFYLARFNFSFSSEGLFTSLSFLTEMFRAIFKDFWWSFYFFGFIIATLALTIYISTICFIGIIVYSKFPVFMHDIKEDWKNILLLIPSILLMFIGPPFALLALLLPFWIYLDKNQRILSFVNAAVIGILFTMLPLLSMFVTLPNYQSFKDIITINDGNYTGLEFQSLKNDSTWQSLFSQAIAHRSNGNSEDAIAIYNNLLKMSEDPRFYNNLGNCYAMKGDYKSALSYYKKAFEIKKSAPLLYNMSQVLREELEFKEAELYYNWALDIDPFIIPSGKKTGESIEGLLFIDEGLKRTELWNLAFEMASNYTFEPYIKNSLSSLSVIPSLFLLVIISFASAFSGKYRKSGTYQCRRCGDSYCPSCEKRVFTHLRHFSKDVCVLCFKTLVRLTDLEPKKRVEHLLSIQRNKSLRLQKFKIMEIFIPGSGYLYFERTLYGALIVFLYFFSISLFLLTLVITPFPASELSSYLFRWTAIGCFIFVYFFSLIITFRRSYRRWL